MSAARRVDDVIDVCRDGDVAECNELTRSQYFGEGLATELPALAAKCGAPVTHTKQEFGMDFAGLFVWNAKITLALESGDCRASIIQIELVEGPWRWRVNRIGPAPGR